MGEVLRFKKPTAKQRHRGNTLCRQGFHKWTADKTTPYDVKQGRMLTTYRCVRCGKTKAEAR